MLVNVTELLVRHAMSEMEWRRRLPCDCEQCRDDVMALALNQLSPRYVSTDRGEAYVKAQYMNSQLQMDIVRELAVSLQRVANNPRHTGS
ncbi:late competence development ComFB family protein [Alicyclobacillus sp. TC]|uniref:Competence protein ComFB n=1 Tax=Alicyclobacillus tolerans TaxID=90970 RepID=A0A1M6PLR0_9BACL|nr:MULTISPECIES: late competence development ComFB family protein [Alicyclobacillus]QRF22313.1 late competence development ComFB family protein [Alicyclobacillus sp. TC]SHK08926.1 competence protein ComFB [Alicyclobacillus montanus]